MDKNRLRKIVKESIEKYIKESYEDENLLTELYNTYNNLDGEIEKWMDYRKRPKGIEQALSEIQKAKETIHNVINLLETI